MYVNGAYEFPLFPCRPDFPKETFLLYHKGVIFINEEASEVRL
jgi:hypothetical protein